MILRPVIAPFDQELRGRAALEEGRRLGRLALAASAARCGAPRDLGRDARGAPAASGGWSWSNTNTRGLAAAVVAPARVGIDAEWLDRPRLDAVRERFADELGRLGSDRPETVLRLWTAKEAVLKAYGVGLADLPRCPLAEEREEGLVLAYRGRLHAVRQWRFGRHLLAVACAAPGFAVEPSELTPREADGAPA